MWSIPRWAILLLGAALLVFGFAVHMGWLRDPSLAKADYVGNIDVSAEDAKRYRAVLFEWRVTSNAGSFTGNDILTNYPDVYLYGCLVEAAIFTQGEAEAQRYLQLYNASVAGLNARTQRITGSAAPVIRLRTGMLP